MCDENNAAEPEFATALIAVWWDMNDCPVPEGYDPRRVRQSLEWTFKKRGYSGPVFITGYADQKHTPAHLLQGLYSTGVSVAHTVPECKCAHMFADMLIWRNHNSCSTTMMLISNQVDDVFAWDLARLQQQSPYNIFVANSISSVFKYYSPLVTCKEWPWKKLLKWYPADEPIICRETYKFLPHAFFYCKSCNFFKTNTVEKFKKHLWSREHALREITHPCARELDPVTRTWGKNYPARPAYGKSKIEVWWDMEDCPIPEGYDARRVRPSLEAAFKNLGYSGPVSITGYGDQTKTPDHLLQGLSSTGVSIAHNISDATSKHIFFDLVDWQNQNPPPATLMVISDHLTFSVALARSQQLTIYNLFLAYSYRPDQMSVLVTSAEWLWDSLLAGLCFVLSSSIT
ncbi:hypothetical protein CARUB_v10020408mg [Capsella rubella]|uniref:NYN domain-containing protein n=1 Tax=Capsella rubella TaxID=81985 RepID=R0HZB9_9BRAS|nr:hypothetical protein CARUB_v10020408mg [Capsella rubella]